MAGVRVSLEKGEGREAILLLEGFPQGCRRARGIIQVSTCKNYFEPLSEIASIETQITPIGLINLKFID